MAAFFQNRKGEDTIMCNKKYEKIQKRLDIEERDDIIELALDNNEC